MNNDISSDKQSKSHSRTIKNLKTEYYKFVQNIKCEFFPCHKIKDINNFNCLFCYCPLYFLEDKCGGNFKYTKNGIKDCSNCIIPHDSGGYDYVISKLKDWM